MKKFASYEDWFIALGNELKTTQPATYSTICLDAEFKQLGPSVYLKYGDDTKRAVRYLVRLHESILET